jgi:SAM-dependent methyltransferase
MSERATLLSILAISFALLVDEIMLSAIFHVLLGAGNTVAAIAIALVGLSAGGIVAYTFPAIARGDSRPGQLVFWFVISVPLSIYTIMAVPLHHGDLIYHHGDASVQFWRLVVQHVTVLPFFLGGLTIAVLFRRAPDRIGTLYAGDLLGAALGCIASPLLLTTVGAPAAVLWGVMPAALLGLVHVTRQNNPRRWLALLPIALLLAPVLRPELLAFARISTMGTVESPAYRGFPITRADVEYERWALDAWTIIRGPSIPQQWESFRGWGLSPSYRGPIPPIKLVNYNARFSTYVTRRDGDPAALAAWLDADLSSLHHTIGRHYESVLNIGAGGGREVLAALQHGAQRVVAVDVSEVVVEDLMKGHLREWSGELYLDPRVEAVADEGRSYTERSSERFDLIEFSIVGGMNLEKMDLVRVDDLFTVEALGTYLSRLRPDGVFSYVMYSTRSDIAEELSRDTGQTPQPYVPALRTLAGLRLALLELSPGIDFANHVLVAALPGVINPTYDLVHIAVSRSPFTDLERERFVENCRRLEFGSLYPAEPGAPNPYARVATTPDFDGLAAELAFGIRPPTDDRPFQYSLDASKLRRALDRGELLQVLAANPLISLGTSIGALAALLTLTPLFASRQRREHLARLGSQWRLLLYFACLGFAYMGVEIAALLRLQSYLGKPIYGLSVGLFAFLLASGLGSAWTRRIGDAGLERWARGIALVIVALGLVFISTAPSIFSSTIAWPLPARIGVSVASILPLAFPMGMLFPIGIRILARSADDLVPWAWATNGCFSVIGIFSTRVTALLVGFSHALLIALVVYALVTLFVRTRRAEG